VVGPFPAQAFDGLLDLGITIEKLDGEGLARMPALPHEDSHPDRYGDSRRRIGDSLGFASKVAGEFDLSACADRCFRLHAR
jgi:hypothetical protein